MKLIWRDVHEPVLVCTTCHKHEVEKALQAESKQPHQAEIPIHELDSHLQSFGHRYRTFAHLVGHPSFRPRMEGEALSYAWAHLPFPARRAFCLADRLRNTATRLNQARHPSVNVVRPLLDECTRAVEGSPTSDERRRESFIDFIQRQFTSMADAARMLMATARLIPITEFAFVLCDPLLYLYVTGSLSRFMTDPAPCPLRL